MRELLLLRHAKSSWDDPGLADHDRPLSSRGVRAATTMGREIARRGWVPDAALVSTALRTRETLALAGREWPREVAATFDPSIYEAAPQAILAAIRRTPDRVARLLVVGHNPGLERLAAALAGPGSGEDALARLREKFPTAALARFEFPSGWAELKPGAAEPVILTAG